MSLPDPPSTPRRDGLRLALLAGSLFLLVGGVAAFNAWEDPYGRFGSKASIARVHGSNTNLPLRTLIELQKVSEAEFARAEVVIIGDSRGAALTEERQTVMRGHPVLNVACGGARMEEYLTILQLHEHHLRGAKLLLVLAPVELFGCSVGKNRAQETAAVGKSTLHYLLNWKVCQDSWSVLWSRQPPPQKKERPARPADQQRANDETLGKAWRGLIQSYDPQRVPPRLELLREALRPFQARGAKVVLWSPPLQTAVHTALEEDHLQAALRDLLPRLEQYGPYVNWSRAAEIDGSPLHFSDPVHTTDSALLLGKLMQAGGL